jgi:DNA-directed RNA polymerase beta subunit
MNRDYNRRETLARPGRQLNVYRKEGLALHDRIDIEAYRNTDRFLGEEVLFPFVRSTDGSRELMASSQVHQALVLTNGEFPRVFTGYENQVGKYSSAYLRAEQELKILEVIGKNPYNALIVYEDEEGTIGVIWRKECESLSEHFGYQYDNTYLDGKWEGDTIAKGDVIRRGTAYDEEMNFSFGTNLRAVYIPWDGMTFEDAIVISESTSKKLETSLVEVVTINMNTNDLALNLYGDEDPSGYKSFPDIGEEVKNGILMARRRINYESALVDLSTNLLTQVNPSRDTVFYCNGTVVDIEIFNNDDVNRLEKYDYNAQMLKYLAVNMEFYRDVDRVLGAYINGGRSYTEDAAAAYRRARDICKDGEERIRWRQNKNDFESYVIRFTLLHKTTAKPGSKLANRYGGKGVISLILPDDQMPVNEHGERAEIILSPLGVTNRLNPSQLIEQELNFVADHIMREARKAPDTMTAWGLIQDLLIQVSPTQASAMASHLYKEDMESFVKSILDDKLYIHQAPFWGNLDLGGLIELYTKYPWIKPYKMSCSEKPLIMGDIYFMLLKHEPMTKFSVRSTSTVSNRGTPSKSSRYKEHQQPFSHTPIKIGEMETFNMFATGNFEEVLRMLNLYSSNPGDREHLANVLLKTNIFDSKQVDSLGGESSVKSIMDVLLTSAGLRLTD